MQKNNVATSFYDHVLEFLRFLRKFFPKISEEDGNNCCLV